MCSIKAFIIKYLIVLPAVLCSLKALGSCTKGLWIRADILKKVKLQEGHPTRKINWCSQLKAPRPIPSRGE